MCYRFKICFGESYSGAGWEKEQLNVFVEPEPQASGYGAHQVVKAASLEARVVTVVIVALMTVTISRGTS